MTARSSPRPRVRNRVETASKTRRCRVDAALVRARARTFARSVVAMGVVTRCTAIARRMGYQTNKYVKIIDWRLALTNYVLQVLIIFYVVYSLVAGKAFLQKEVPIGRVSNWGNGNADFDSIQELTRASTAMTTTTLGGKSYNLLPCASGAPANALEDYKFNYSAAWDYADVRCAYLTPAELITKRVDGGIFVTTHITETVTYREPKSGSSCAATVNFQDGANNAVSVPVVKANGTAGVCYYSKQIDWLAIGAEHTSIGITHEFETAEGAYDAKMPKTYVRRKGETEDLLVFESGRPIELTLRQILDVAQVKLDERYEDQVANVGKDVSGEYGRGADAARTPKARLGGVRIFASIKYYNYNLHARNTKEEVAEHGSTPYAILELEPTFTWTGLGQKISYRSLRDNIDDPIQLGDGMPKGYLSDMYHYGVFVDVTTSGVVGALNVVYIINVLVSGLVMLNVAKSICDLLAMYGLGTRSLVYKSHIIEETNFEREAAKYAMQGLLSIPTFKRADTSGGNGLDIDEIYALVKDAFHGTDGMSLDEEGLDSAVMAKRRLNDEECRQVARYIMLSGDRNAVENFNAGKPALTYDELKDQRLDLEEWIDLCTEGPMNTGTLRKVIDMDSNEEARQRRLRAMFGEENAPQ